MPINEMPKWLRYSIVLVALGLIIYEATWYKGQPRYWLLVLYAGMLGLPALFGLSGRGGGEDPPTPPAPPANEEKT